MADKTIIETLRGQVGKLIGDNRRLREELSKVSAERDRATVKRREAENRIILLEKRIVTLETAGGLGGTRADNRAARLRVNKLLREIDRCIAMMNR